MILNTAEDSSGHKILVNGITPTPVDKSTSGRCSTLGALHYSSFIISDRKSPVSLGIGIADGSFYSVLPNNFLIFSLYVVYFSFSLHHIKQALKAFLAIFLFPTSK